MEGRDAAGQRGVIRAEVSVLTRPAPAASADFGTPAGPIRPQNASSGYAHRCDRQPPLWIEHIVERIREQLLPLFDRSNRVMIRNLKAQQARQDGRRRA